MRSAIAVWDQDGTSGEAMPSRARFSIATRVLSSQCSQPVRRPCRSMARSVNRGSRYSHVLRETWTAVQPYQEAASLMRPSRMGSIRRARRSSAALIT